MNRITVLGLIVAASMTNACSTTTEAVSLPFDLASTTGDAASSSSSGGDEKSSDSTTAQQRYVRSQIAWIQRDAARGHGENLAALAQLLGEPDQAEFATWTHANYDALFANLQQPEELLARIEAQRTVTR